MKPLIWLMNGSARVIIRMFGVNPDAQTDAMSEEEIKKLLLTIVIMVEKSTKLNWHICK